MSTSLKDQGTAAFRSGKWEEAVRLYTAALKQDSISEEAGACYSNRAAANIHLYRYDLGERVQYCQEDLSDPSATSQPYSTLLLPASFGRLGLALSLAELKPTLTCNATISLL